MIAAEKFPHNNQPNFNHTDSTTLHSNSPPLSISESTMPPTSQDQAGDKRQAAREVIDILQEISDLLVRAHSPRTRQDSGFI